MSAVKQPVRGPISSPHQSHFKSPLFLNKKDAKNNNNNKTPSVARHRVLCARKLLCKSPTPVSNITSSLSLEKQESKDSSGISVCVIPCSPGGQVHSSTIKATSRRELRSEQYLQEPTSSEFLKPVLRWENQSGIPISPSTLDSVLSPASHRSPQDCEKFASSSPLYTPDRKDVFLGRGSFGNVTLCHYKGHKFALKVVQNTSSSDVGEKNLLGVRHAHLVRILHVSELKDRVFICMEFAGHCNLQQLLDSRGYLDFKRRLSFAHQVASGLSHCHKLSIIHRDVKPANAIVSPSGLCKLGDFGHSLKLNPSFNTASPSCVLSPKGTVSHTAPEVLRGFLPTFASDVYSLGVTLWQTHSREMPFPGEHPHVVIYKVVSSHVRPRFKNLQDDDEHRFAKIAENCWDADPDKRPRADDVVHALLNLLKY